EAGGQRLRQRRQGPAGADADCPAARAAGRLRPRLRRDRDRHLPRALAPDQPGGGPVIAFLRGRVLRLTPEMVVLDVNGVGYQLAMTASVRDRMPTVGGETELWVHTHVREDTLALFGFSSVDELEMFKMLIEVDGVGPKVGIAIL